MLLLRGARPYVRILHYRHQVQRLCQVIERAQVRPERGVVQHVLCAAVHRVAEHVGKVAPAGHLPVQVSARAAGDAAPLPGRREGQVDGGN